MATKAEVIEFLQKVQHKAVKTVNEKYDANYKNAVELYMTKYHGELLNFISSFVDDVRRLRETNKEFKEKVGAGSWECNYVQAPSTTFDTIVGVYEFLAKNKPSTFVESKELNKVKTITEEQLAERQKVADEYNKIIRFVTDNCRDGRNALKFVESLDFDVSSLKDKKEVSVEINKANLFVCGEDRA